MLQIGITGKRNHAAALRAFAGSAEFFKREIVFRCFEGIAAVFIGAGNSAHSRPLFSDSTSEVSPSMQELMVESSLRSSLP